MNGAHARSILLEGSLRPEQAAPEVNIYVNIPFCPSKCHYCAWVAWYPAKSLVRGQSLHERYVGSLIQQIDSTLKAFPEHQRPKLGHVYFGGGTPTVLPAESLLAALDRVRVLTDAIPDDTRTTTLEASPDTVEYEELLRLREGGFDRISIGFQSFDDELLSKLGRSARACQAEPAVNAARRAGFDNLNADVMFGLPDETCESWRQTVRGVLELEPEHISVYRYLSAFGTVSTKRVAIGSARLAPADRLFERFNWARELIIAAGYYEYIEGLFARNGRHCAMDESYFKLSREWIGFGAGANSLFAGSRWLNEVSIEKFISDPMLSTRLEACGLGDTATLVSQMLRTDGIDKVNYLDRLGHSIETAMRDSKKVRNMLAPLLSGGQLSEEPNHFLWTEREHRTRWLCGM